MLNNKTKLLLCASTLLLAPFVISASSVAEDCTGVLPTANCTLDEDTTAPLTIDGGVVLTIGSSVVLDHEIDGDDNIGDGSIDTFGGPNTITQNADIGRNTPIGGITISDDNIWNSSAAIITDSGGSDIDLGAADGGEVLNFLRGSSYSGEIDGNFADTLTFGIDGNGGDFVTGGQIETVILIVGSGQLMVNNTVGGGTPLASLTVQENAVLDMGANVTTSGAVDIDGRVNIGAGTTLAGDTYVADANAATVVLEIERAAGSTESGVLNITSGGPLDLSNDTIQVALGDRSEVLVNETVASVIIGNTAATIAPNRFVDDSFLYDFSLVANGNDFDLVIVANSLDDSASNENNLRVATTLLGNLANVDQAELNSVQAALGNAPDRSSFNERLEALQPTVDSGYINASLVAKNQLLNSGRSRVETLFETTIKPKKSTLISGSKNLYSDRKRRSKDTFDESFVNEKGVLWAQGYANKSTQSRKDSIDGFDMNAAGVILGADSGRMNRNTILGVALLAGSSSIDSNNANVTQTDVDSYGLSFYGGNKLSKKTLLSGSVSYVHNTNDVTRYNVGGLPGLNASHENVIEHLSFNTKLSHRYKTVKKLTITPSATLGYDYLYIDKYNENGAGALSLSVDPDPIQMLSAGLGVDLDWHYQTASGIKLNPNIYAHYKYNLLNDRIKSSAVFQGADAEGFVTEGFEPQRSQLNMGTEISAEVAEDWFLVAKYGLELKDKFASHSGNINAVHNF